MSDGAKRKMPKTPADHPKYEEMIKTRYSYAKGTQRFFASSHREVHQSQLQGGRYSSPAHQKQLSRRGAANGTFIHTKGVGASGSFKLPKEQKKPSKKASRAE